MIEPKPARKGLRENSRKSCATQSRKGFIFTLLVLVIIVFMIVEISIYFRTYELRQESEPNKIRSQVISEAASQFTLRKLTETIGVPVYAALYSLNNDSASGFPPQYDNLTGIAWAMVWNGTRPDLGGIQKVPQESTLSFWDSRMRQTVDSMGMALSTEYSNISLAQSDPWTVQLNFTMSFSLTDPVSTARIASEVPMSINTSIVGFEDPLLSRSLQVKRSIIPVSSQPLARVAASGDKGRGWFYGQPAKVRVPADVTFNSSNKRMIMVTEDLGSVAIQYGNIYGAVVVLGPQPDISFPEINVPVMFIRNLSIDDAMFSEPFLFASDRDDIVTDTGVSAYHYIYDMEPVRDYAQCGLYANHTGFGHSYLSRLTGNPVADPTGSLGIETVIGGMQFLASQYQHTDRSAVDHMYLPGSGTGITRVMGLPGCNDKVSCGMTTNNPIPIKLDSSHISSYGLSGLQCGTTRCG
ncbi:Uncharacterised protein [uncultured archaeon]|nr:Uncharacterised protein [uncultured archaeon]